jgi:hypothetical protein
MEQSFVHFCETVKETESVFDDNTEIGNILYFTASTDPTCCGPIIQGSLSIGIAVGPLVGSIEGALLGAALRL